MKTFGTQSVVCKMAKILVQEGDAIMNGNESNIDALIVAGGHYGYAKYLATIPNIERTAAHTRYGSVL